MQLEDVHWLRVDIKAIKSAGARRSHRIDGLSGVKGMSTIFLTGGSGFFGSHMLAELLRGGHTVVNYDIRKPALTEQLPYWYRGDILDRDHLGAAIAGAKPGAIIHMAARAEISSMNWSDFASIHEGTRNVVNAASEVPDISRLINISTQLVVGPGSYPASDVDFMPYTTYGEAKAAAERELRERDPGMTWLIVRPTNIWGPRHPSFGVSIWRYLAKRFYLHPVTSTPVMRCYGYVGNAVEQIMALLEAPHDAVHKKVFYLADGEIDSALWLDALSLSLTGKPTRRVHASLLVALGKLGDMARRLGVPSPIDSGRVMRMTTSYPVPLKSIFEIAGRPRISLQTGVDETVRWLREVHPEIYGGR